MNNINSLKTFFLTSAIINIVSFLGWSIYTIASGIIICGLGCLFGVFPIVAAISCVMDFVAYTKLSKQNKTGTFGTAKFAAILEIVTFVNGNIVSVVLGILSLTQLNNPELRNYLFHRGIY